MSANRTSQLRNTHISIVGLGLMGGSLALALKPHVRRLSAVEIDRRTRLMALEKEIVDDATDDVEAGISRADLVILATPVNAILEIVSALPRWRQEACILLDLGSTKREICAAMDRLPPAFGAIGGHPMCGKESSGLTFAEANLYRGQTFVLCRTERTDAPTESMILSLLDIIGANSLFLEPHEHDRLVATVSHLPYFLASLLMQQAAEVRKLEKDLWSVSASGFRDTTRLSGSNAHMLKDIVQTNRAPILQALKRHADGVEALIALLERGDDEALGAWLQARQREREAYLRAAGERR